MRKLPQMPRLRIGRRPYWLRVLPPMKYMSMDYLLVQYSLLSGTP